MEIVLIRHTAVDVAKGVCYGQTDVSLKGSFEQEATVVAQKLKGVTFDKVFTSPLSRCVRLAAFCGYREAVRDSRILELNFGDWEMQRFDAISDPRLAEWYADYLHIAPTGGESFSAQLARVSDFLDELRREDYRRVAIFAHGGVLLCAQIYAGILRMEEAFDAVPPYGGVVSFFL